MQIQKLSYLGLIAFSCSLFLPTTINTICFVIGILCWILSGNYFNPKLRLFNYLILIQLGIEVMLHFKHPLDERSILILSKDLFKVYSQWFWFTSTWSINTSRRKRNSILLFICFSVGISFLVCLQSFNILKTSLAGSSGFQVQPYTTGALILILYFLTLHILYPLLIRFSHSNRIKIFGRIQVTTQHLLLNLK